MKTKLFAGFLLAASCMFAGPRISIGVGIGGPVGYGYYAPAPAYVPGPGYVWVSGYWYGYGPQRVWRAGYWAPGRAYYGARLFGAKRTNERRDLGYRR